MPSSSCLHAALETFLNITPEKPPCRQLIAKLLSILCQIMLFFRTQRQYRFYSSSLLVAYDAQRLRHCPADDEESASSDRTVISDASAPKEIVAPHLSSSSSIASVPAKRTAKRSRTEVLASPLQRSVSLSTGFVETIEDEKISNQSGSCSSDAKAHLRLYRSGAPGVTTTADERDWVRVNMIDFTHVFPADDEGSLDRNYLEGIENLIKLLESFVPRKLDSLDRENSRVGVML